MKTRSFRRRRARVPKPRVPKDITWGQFATKAWSGVQQIRKLINVEEHRHDTPVGTTINNVGSVTHLTAIAAGDDQFNRTGSSILSKGIHARIVLLKAAAATQTVVRCFLVRDKQQVSDTSPTIAQLLNTADVVAHVTPDFTERFTVLRDYTTVFDSLGVGTLKNIEFKVDLSSKHVRYNGTASSDIQQGGLYWVMISNESVNLPTISAVFRFTFYDN